MNKYWGKLQVANENIIVEVNPVIDEFMNHGMTYLVYYKVPRFANTDGFRAFTTKNKLEAINKLQELQLKINL